MTDEQWVKFLTILGEEKLDRLFEKNRAMFERRLESLAETYGERSKQMADPQLPATAGVSDLIAEHARNPLRLAVLLQALAFSVSSDILAMMWMVMFGARLERIEYKYERRSQTSLEVEISPPSGGPRLTFRSTDHWDSAALRLMALSKSGDRPVIDDFYPLYPTRG